MIQTEKLDKTKTVNFDMGSQLIYENSSFGSVDSLDLSQESEEKHKNREKPKP